MSCLQKGTAIQSRRLSEYNCYASMVLWSPLETSLTQHLLLRNLSGKRMKSARSNINAVFGHFLMHVSWTALQEVKFREKYMSCLFKFSNCIVCVAVVV